MHSELFSIFGLKIYSYGLCLGLSIVFGWHLLVYFASRDGMPVDRYKAPTFIAVVISLFCARALFFVSNPELWDWSDPGRFFKLIDGGLVAYGGLLGGSIAAWFTMRKLEFWRFLDHTTPSFAMGLMITRIGCFLNGCDFGKPCAVPWGVAFPSGSPAWRTHVERRLIESNAEQSLVVHPTQLYESLMGLGLLLLLLWSRHWRRFFHGQQLLLFMGSYGFLRFLNEYLRDDPQRGGFWIFSTSQWISLALVPGALLAAVYLRKHHPVIELARKPEP